MTLDVTREEAVPLLTDLAADVDVVIASPSAGTPVAGFVAEPAGLAWCPPAAVVCFVTPFGVTGPLRDWRATPLTAHAMSGLMHAVGPPEGPPRAMPGRQLWDEAGVRAAICIAAALHERPRVEGRVLDISAHEVMAGQDDIIHRFDVAGLVLRRNTNFGVPPSGAWAAADGLVDIAANTSGHWTSFVATMGSPPDLADPMWEDRGMRAQLHDVITEQIEPRLRTWRRHDFIAEAQANGLPCAALNTPEQFVEDQRADPREPLGTLRHPDLGSCQAPGAPIRVVPAIYASDVAAPCRGEHTVDVVVEALGHDPTALHEWRERGLV